MKIIENQKQFTVADLIEVLQDQDQNLPVDFGQLMMIIVAWQFKMKT